MSSSHKLSAILVDDEPKAIKNLQYLLERYCPEINILSTANTVDNAKIEIEKHKPDVVFLDIEMPKKSGFELLEITTHPFQTIFVTAYDNFAIKAFEVSAVDYLLKPIEIERLQQAVGKLSKEKNTAINNNVLITNINAKKITQIVIPYKDAQMVVKLKDIICFEANQAYCKIYFIKNNSLTVQLYSKSLSYFHDMLKNHSTFFRSNRSWLLNLEKVITFSKKKHLTQLAFNIEATISKNKLKDFESQLKSIFEN